MGEFKTSNRIIAFINPLCSAIPIPSNDFAFYDGASVGENYLNNLQIERYDKYGNICQYKRRGDNYSTTIIWRNDNRPIAKIENSTYEDFLTNSGYQLYELQNLTGSHQIYVFYQIRKMPLFKDALITSYTYNNDLTLRSITDVNGKTISHEYDGFNRLETLFREEFNDNGSLKNERVLQHIDYHYQNQENK